MRTLARLSIALLLAAGCEVAPNPAPTSTLAPTALPSAAPTVLPTATWSASAQPLDTVIRLTWAPVAGARAYNVYRDGNSVPLNAAPLSDTTYEDIGLSNGRTYRYSIAALDANGQAIRRSPEVLVAPRAP